MMLTSNPCVVLQNIGFFDMEENSVGALTTKLAKVTIPRVAAFDEAAWQKKAEKAVTIEREAEEYHRETFGKNSHSIHMRVCCACPERTNPPYPPASNPLSFVSSNPHSSSGSTNDDTHSRLYTQHLGRKSGPFTSISSTSRVEGGALVPIKVWAQSAYSGVQVQNR
jgi:hypothetical protein